jgi:hypothetical protein
MQLSVQPVNQRGGVEILDGRTGPPEGGVGILRCLQSLPIDRHRRRIPSFGSEEPIPIERGAEDRYILHSAGRRASRHRPMRS